MFPRGSWCFGLLLMMMQMGCGESVDPGAEEPRDGGSAGSTKRDAGRADASPRDAGQSAAPTGECKTLASCCTKVSAERATCELIVQQGSSGNCGIALLRYGTECPALADQADKGTTVDGWSYYPGWRDTTFSGFRQRLSDMSGMFAARSGSVFGWDFTGTLWRSSDLGNNWSTLGKDGTRVVAEPQEGVLLGLSKSNLVRSTDDGASWQRVTKAVEDKITTLVALDAETLYAVSEQTITLSRDGGETFVPFADQVELAGPLLVDRYQTLYLFQGDRVAIRRKGDPRLFEQRFAGQVSSALRLADDTLLAATDKGLYRSKDYGGSWQQVATVPSSFQIFANAEGAVFVTSSRGLQVSTDGGVSFRALGPTRQQPVSVAAVALLPDQRVLLSADGLDGDFYVSGTLELVVAPTEPPAERPASCVDGEQGGDESSVDCGGGCGPCPRWERTTTVPGFRYFASDGLVYATHEGLLQVSSDLMHTWREIGPGPTVIYDRAGLLYGRVEATAGTPVALVSSRDGGKSWQPFASGMLPSVVDRLFYSPTREQLLLTSGASLYLLSEADDSWQLAQSFMPGGSVLDLVEASSGRMFARVGTYGSGARLYSTAGGASEWALVGPLGPSAIALHGDTLYVKETDTIGRLLDATTGKVETIPCAVGVQRYSIAVDSGGRLFFTTHAGLAACRSDMPKAQAELVFAGNSSDEPTVLANDRILFGPYLGGPTTAW